MTTVYCDSFSGGGNISSFSLQHNCPVPFNRIKYTWYFDNQSNTAGIYQITSADLLKIVGVYRYIPGAGSQINNTSTMSEWRVKDNFSALQKYNISDTLDLNFVVNCEYISDSI